MAALPVSVLRKLRPGAVRFRAQAVRPVNGVVCASATPTGLSQAIFSARTRTLGPGALAPALAAPPWNWALGPAGSGGGPAGRRGPAGWCRVARLFLPLAT